MRKAALSARIEHGHLAAPGVGDKAVGDPTTGELSELALRPPKTPSERIQKPARTARTYASLEGLPSAPTPAPLRYTNCAYLGGSVNVEDDQYGQNENEGPSLPRAG
jgi:hypothetical protein